MASPRGLSEDLLLKTVFVVLVHRVVDDPRYHLMLKLFLLHLLGNNPTGLLSFYAPDESRGWPVVDPSYVHPSLCCPDDS